MSRFNYVEFDEYAQAEQNSAKKIALNLEFLIESLGKGRSQHLALTNLEECYMWIGKAIRDKQIERNSIGDELERANP